MQKARIAVVGLGTVGQTVHLPILSKFPDAQIVDIPLIAENTDGGSLASGYRFCP